MENFYKIKLCLVKELCHFDITLFYVFKFTGNSKKMHAKIIKKHANTFIILILV